MSQPIPLDNACRAWVDISDVPVGAGSLPLLDEKGKLAVTRLKVLLAIFVPSIFVRVEDKPFRKFGKELSLASDAEAHQGGEVCLAPFPPNAKWKEYVRYGRVDIAEVNTQVESTFVECQNIPVACPIENRAASSRQQATPRKYALGRAAILCPPNTKRF